MRHFAKFLLILLTFAAAYPVGAEPLWRMFRPVDRVEARVDGEYALGQQNGPWLVMAATFSGPEAEGQARELVLELRQHFNLPAYLHSMTFDHTSENDRIGRGIDRLGAPLRMRYQAGEQSEEFAVLVGDFSTIDDPAAQELLDRVKSLQPKALSGDLRETAQNLAQEREYLKRLAGDKNSSPMRKAFLTRNPVLPAEYFKPKGVDDFVAKMNSGVDHSLLDCPGKYTVAIATFRGKAELQGAFSSGRSNRRKKEPEIDPLEEAAINAHMVATFLRAKGWSAYEFHDRTESLVTIGSFDQVATRDATGQLRPEREVDILLRTFGAAYDTPTSLTVGANVPPEDRVRAEQVKQQFNNLFSKEQGQIASGLQPKYIQPIKNGPFIPLDIHPEVIEAPKRSVTSAYAWRR